MRKNLLVLGMSVATVVAVSFFAFQKNVEQTYVPRSENNSDQGIKGAQEFYKMMRADLQTGEVNQALILQKKAEITAQIASIKKSGSSAMDWEEMGPNNVGGRTRAFLAFDANTLFAGSVSGGLWKSTDDGQSWSNVSSFDQNLAIGSMAKLGNGWIVVGTGCLFESPSGQGNTGNRGDGLFVSKDGGTTFSIVKDDGDKNVDYSEGWKVFNRLIADPNNNNVVWAACSNGIQKMNIQTGEFVRPTGASGNTCYDISLSADGNQILASYANAFALSNDGGESFSFIHGSGAGKLKAPTGRATVAISQDDVAYMYALMAKSNGTFDALYYSADTGNTWTLNWSNPQYDPFISANGQGFYDQAITIIPGKPRQVLIAGITLWIAGPGHQPEQVALNFASPFSPSYVHSDIHLLTWIGNDRLIVGCDGGLHFGTYNQSGFSFSMRNNGYNVTQFYGIGVDGSGKIIGGTQDNGTQYVTGAGANPKKAYRVIGGDGFTCDLSTLLPTAGIGSVYTGAFRRAQDVISAGFSGFVEDISNNDFGDFVTVGALYENDYDWKARAVQYSYTNMDTRDTLFAGETVFKDSKVLTGLSVSFVLEEDLIPGAEVQFYDKTNVMYAVDGGSAIYLTREVWDFETTPEFWLIANNQSGVNKMAFSKDGDHLFLAKFGGVTRISGLRDAWNEDEADVNGANYSLTKANIQGIVNVSDVAVDPHNSDHIVAVMYGYSANGGIHVYESENATQAGASFTPIQGDLPDIPVYAVEIDYNDANVIYLGTEEGVYVTEDGGTTWVNQVVNGFARVPTFDLRIQNIYSGRVNNTGVVYAGTHGRGFFKMENRLVEFDSTTIGIQEIEVSINSNLKVFPNPVVDNATIAFDLVKDERATLSILNLTGQVVKTINANNLSLTSENLVEFNVAELPVGTYLVHLNNGADQRIGRFIKTN
jgi:hypothetical protein